MKHLLSIIFLIVPVLLSAQDTFHLKGHVAAWKGTKEIRLSYLNNGKIVQDSTWAIDGRFAFTGAISQPEEAYMALRDTGKGRRDMINIFLGKGTILVNATDSLAHATIKGVAVAEDHQYLKNSAAPLMKRLGDLKLQAVKTTPAERTTQAFKDLEKEYYGLLDSVKQIRIHFIKTHPASYMSLVTIKGMAGPAIEYAQIAPLFNILNPEVRNTPLGREMAQKLAVAKTTRIGEALPAFTSFDTARSALKLDDVLKNSKYTLVDFWASWCKPCRMENPNVVKAYNAFHEKGFNIISVSLDDKAAPWIAAIHKDGMPWYHVSGLQGWKEPVALLYGIAAVPDNFLLDANGKVVARGLKGEALYKKLETVLKN
ncbi:redoxin domain-containing protein [Pseudoflavitalea sp. X16]|uniref:thioredoxin-like domain-containing protein n=1 Tax=Paraflavitalea devenefica TaxID=2716334 RepID=UPI00142470F6|nr:thioredoxin-like domain-containing protein [Paraflavitalea devenefica]NII26073.1 redoxin domain-containing protein [Paraflavitalea devenefica]